MCLWWGVCLQLSQGAMILRNIDKTFQHISLKEPNSIDNNGARYISMYIFIY